ncbi:hypothetical protein NMY22_g1377 [Coprinellus aureogranulatus]|nr:hypothetical protein NMY22_g1377 [Coprinellus aureogranulatus]
MGSPRPVQISYEGLARVDGSARFGFGDTTVAIASVSGPIEVRLASELPSQATFDVSVRPLSNVPSTESKSQASAIRSALAPSLILNKNPRTLIQLVIQTLSPTPTSGPKWTDGLLAAMINASTLALLNAGSVPMRGVVCAIAIGKTPSGELLVDPEDSKTAELVQGGCFGFMVADGAGLESNSTSVWTNWRTLQGGTFSEEEVVEFPALRCRREWRRRQDGDIGGNPEELVDASAALLRPNTSPSYHPDTSTQDATLRQIDLNARPLPPLPGSRTRSITFASRGNRFEADIKEGDPATRPQPKTESSFEIPCSWEELAKLSSRTNSPRVEDADDWAVAAGVQAMIALVSSPTSSGATLALEGNATAEDNGASGNSSRVLESRDSFSFGSTPSTEKHSQIPFPSREEIGVPCPTTHSPVRSHSSKSTQDHYEQLAVQAQQLAQWRSPWQSTPQVLLKPASLKPRENCRITSLGRPRSSQRCSASPWPGAGTKPKCHCNGCHLAASNDCPDFHDTIAIRGLLSHWKDEASSIDKQIKALQEKRNTAEACHRFYEPIFAPVRRVPVEVLGEIFSYLGSQDSLTKICRVCKTWQAAAHGTPRLWQDTVIDLSTGTHQLLFKGIYAWISRAKMFLFCMVQVCAALIMRYKGQKGRLLRVLRRDGGIYYFALTGIELGQAISRTPAIMAVRHLESNAGYWLIQRCQIVVIPIAAQRLMINIRKVNYMDSRPIASKLLFAPLPPSSGDDGDEDRDSKNHFKMSSEEFKFRPGSRAGDSSAA